jgi:hypothetical protein
MPMPVSPTTPVNSEMYYSDAADYFINNCDSEYEYCNDNHFRFFMIRDYALWLFQMNEVIRIWE